MICPHCGMDTNKFETSRSEIEKDKQGRMLTWTEITEDQDKKQVRKRVDSYTHYATGEVDVINQKVFDVADKLTDEKEAKHYRDGRRPVLTTVMAIKEET